MPSKTKAGAKDKAPKPGRDKAPRPEDQLRKRTAAANPMSTVNNGMPVSLTGPGCDTDVSSAASALLKSREETSNTAIHFDLLRALAKGSSSADPVVQEVLRDPARLQELVTFCNAQAVDVEDRRKERERRARAFHNLAALILRPKDENWKGDDKAAETQALQLLERSLQFWGSESMQSGAAQTASRLAGIFERQGRPHSALPLLQRCLAIRTKTLGPADKKTLSTKSDLDRVKRVLGLPTDSRDTEALQVSCPSQDSVAGSHGELEDSPRGQGHGGVGQIESDSPGSENVAPDWALAAAAAADHAARLASSRCDSRRGSRAAGTNPNAAQAPKSAATSWFTSTEKFDAPPSHLMATDDFFAAAPPRSPDRDSESSIDDRHPTCTALRGARANEGGDRDGGAGVASGAPTTGITPKKERAGDRDGKKSSRRGERSSGKKRKGSTTAGNGSKGSAGNRDTNLKEEVQRGAGSDSGHRHSSSTGSGEREPTPMTRVRGDTTLQPTKSPHRGGSSSHLPALPLPALAESDHNRSGLPPLPLSSRVAASTTVGIPSPGVVDFMSARYANGRDRRGLGRLAGASGAPW